LAFLFALPALVAGLTRYYDPSVRGSTLEYALLFTLFPHALLPLAALWYGSGMIQDEIEDQTLTYLLVRPLPRWAIYLTKLAATVLITSLIAAVFCLATYAAIYAGAPDLRDKGVPERALKTAALFALTLLTYCSIFGCLSLFVRRSLLIGVAYIGVFEGFIANIPFVVRAVTVMYYFRLLVEHWLGLRFADWSMSLSEAPTANTAVLVLLGASLATTLIASATFTMREFRLKTPEGS
jgi:ABC-2 type transport system permease protein